MSLPAGPCEWCQHWLLADQKFCENCGRPRAEADPPTNWWIVIRPDLGHFQNSGIDDVPFPGQQPPRTMELTADEVSIGRRGVRRRIEPDVDLAGPPADPGVSHLHAVLNRTARSTWTVRDAGSRNGTTLNDDPNPIEPGRPIPLRDGDRIYLGAWTLITVRHGTGTDPGQR